MNLTPPVKRNLLPKNLIVTFHVYGSCCTSRSVTFYSIIGSLPWWLQVVQLFLEVKKKYLSNISSHVQDHITLVSERRNKNLLFGK